MKSEHRHELAENDLSKLLGRWGAEFDKHANIVLSVLIVALLSAAGLIVWFRTSSATNAAGWAELTAASTAEEYVDVAEMFPGTKVAEWATLRAGDGFLQEGIRLSLTDRPVSNERLQQAEESYDGLLNNRSAPREIREQALMGYAVTLETLSDGDTSDAIAAYEALITEFETTRFKTFAEDRIKALKTGGVQDFYAWFHQLNPKPDPRPLPQDQADPFDPNGLGNLLRELGGTGVPELPTLDFPETGTGETQDDDGNPFAAEQEMKDAAAGDKEDTSSDQTPAEGAKPDGDTPEAAAEKTPEAKPEPKPEESTPDDSTSAETPSNESAPKSENGSTPESP